MKQAKKESAAYSFSYLDVFFLLLAGFVLSILIYFASDQARKIRQIPDCVVEVTASYRDEIMHAVPEEGELLFDEKANVIGQVLEVEIFDQVEIKGETKVRLLCLTKGISVQEGEPFSLETARSRNEGNVVSVSEYKEKDAV